MSITVNGATNTITAPSGLAIAGNTVVTGMLSATKNTDGEQVFTLLNNSAGTSAYSIAQVTNGTTALQMFHTGTGFTPSGIYPTDGTVISGTGAGGLRLNAGYAGAELKLLTQGVERAAVSSAGLAVTGKVVVSGDNPSVSANDSAGYLGLAGGTAVGSDGASLQLSGSTSADAGDSFSNARTHYLRNLAGTVQYATFSSTALTLGTGVNLVMAPSYIEGAEMTAPAAPAANGFRIFAEDNGAGKTRLMVQFATGAAQQLAIEP